MTWIGAAIGAVGNLLGNLFGWKSNENTNAANTQQVQATNAANLQIAQNTNAMNQAINERNIAFQQAENDIARQREDNAVQRRASDLVAAGLSKTLAAGSPAAANAMQAPQATQAMQQAHSMQAAHLNAFRPDFSGISSAVIADKEADAALISARAAEARAKAESEHWENQDEETRRHNQEVESENARYHDLDDKWHSAQLDQNSQFHDDALQIDQAYLALSNVDYLNKWDQMEFQNAWYAAQTELEKTTNSQMAARLTADLAESAARVNMYFSETRLNTVELGEVKAHIKQAAAMTAYIVSEKMHLDAQTRSVIVDVLTKIWNLSVSKAQGSTTTSTTVSDSVAAENKANRQNATKNVLLGVGLGAVGGALGAAIRPFAGGAAGFIMKKMFGDDSHNLDPADFVR